MNVEIAVCWEKLREAGPYPPEAYAFLQEGLSYTSSRLAEEETLEPTDGRHVTGQELCIGLRDFAIEQYGLLARTVLECWGIRRTEDFGRIVFSMVEAGLMRKTDEDCLEDFQFVYDFEEAFGRELEHC